ncbi:hypothetical protein ACI8AK_02610 [Geodermatophilus sp. SYSU D00867]
MAGHVLGALLLALGTWVGILPRRVRGDLGDVATCGTAWFPAGARPHPGDPFDSAHACSSFLEQYRALSLGLLAAGVLVVAGTWLLARSARRRAAGATV